MGSKGTNPHWRVVLRIDQKDNQVKSENEEHQSRNEEREQD